MFNIKFFEIKERTLAEIVVILVLLAILMMSFIHYFFKQEDNLTNLTFNRLAQSFSAKVTTVHAQWFMDKQPNYVVLVLTNERQSVYVNHKGWVDTLETTNPCASIWQVVLMKPMVFMNSLVSAIEIKPTDLAFGRKCRFELPSGKYFEYSSANGKVSQVL